MRGKFPDAVRALEPGPEVIWLDRDEFPGEDGTHRLSDLLGVSAECVLLAFWRRIEQEPATLLSGGRDRATVSVTAGREAAL